MTTINHKAAMQQALEALEVSTDWDVGAKGKQLQSMKAITALREALDEQAEQEPVAYGFRSRDGVIIECEILPDYYYSVPLYAAPVRTKDLTDEEIYEAVENIIFDENFDINIARAVIAADREKNK